MAIVRDEALVLRRTPLRETSLLATLFCRTQGKIKVLVKGVRKEKNPLAGRFEPFTHLAVVYYERLRSDVHLVSEATVLISNSFLRSRLDLFSYASYMAELTDSLFGVHDPHADIFNILETSFSLFESNPPAHVRLVFEVKMLEIAGWLPVLTQCVLCGEKSFVKVFFSPKHGGILCSACGRGELGSFPISEDTLRSLFFILKAGIQEASKLDLTLQTERELDRILEKFLHYRLEYPLRSSHFLSELQPILSSIHK